MSASKLLLRCARGGVFKMQTAQMSELVIPPKHGNREVVGYGVNGEPSYIDNATFPMPAIRFKEITPDIKVLKEKEKGDWKKLSIEEKKILYRASFCQTFAEMDAPTGEWKSILAAVLFMGSTAIWIFVFLKAFVYEPLPKTFDLEHRLAQLERIRKLDINPVTGINRRQ